MSPTVQEKPYQESKQVESAQPKETLQVEPPVETPIETPFEDPTSDPKPTPQTHTAETPLVETHVVEMPTPYIPAVETPAVETPAAETPAAETPAVETLDIEIPPAETPVPDQPVLDEPVAEPPAPLEKISRLHYLIPASQPNLHLCFNLASSAANRYPVPTILGYHGAGEFDAAVTHLAKLRTIERYLNALEPDEDDDLVVIVDGYDIILQLPPEILIERYFEVVNKADARIARRFGISVAEARSRGLRDTIFWGPDKICWPIDPLEPRCWAVPASSLGPDAFGPNTGSGDFAFADPRWLNSGTVMGPINDMKTLIAATMAEIEATYNAEYEFKESDQYYISNIWGRQEYYRSVKARNGEEVQGGPPDRRLPTTRSDDQETEYHMGIDYESALFQTRAGNDRFMGYLQFSSSGLNANMDIDMFEEGDEFAPYDIEMPANVYSALGKLYDSIADGHPGMVTNDWIRTIKLGVNFVTEHIFPLWHCTGPKQFIADEYPKMWYFPIAKSLIKATVRAFQGDELITSHLVDGRKWAPKTRYPDAQVLGDELGGAWTDLDGGKFVEWHELCGEHALRLFGDEQPPINAQPPNMVKDERPN